MSDNNIIQLTPSFPETLDREAAYLINKKVPKRQTAVAWLGLLAVLVISTLLVGAIFPDKFGFSHIIAFLFGATFFAAYAYLETRQVLKTGIEIQKTARERSKPIVFRFTPNRFVIETANGRTDYTWDAIDEIESLSIGTGVRVGALLYPIADTDLPEALSRRDFRARIDAWRSAT
ncbi:MAG: hypothetical protein ACR2O1_16390 [Boseongicola sp.]